MLPSQLSGADGGDGPQLGSGGPPERRREKKRERGLFDLPESPEEMMKDGEATVAYVSDVVSKLRAEGADVAQGAAEAALASTDGATEEGASSSPSNAKKVPAQATVSGGPKGGPGRRQAPR